jgi:short-subunit dehydrogenase
MSAIFQGRLKRPIAALHLRTGYLWKRRVDIPADGILQYTDFFGQPDSVAEPDLCAINQIQMETVLNKETFGPWALITGASSGIGAEMAHQLAGNGFNLVLVARRGDLLAQLGQNLSEAFGIRYLPLVADLGSENFMESIKKATEELDIGLLISNAGTGKPGKFLSFEMEELKYIVRLNTLSHLELIHYFGRRLVQRGKGGMLLTGAMGASNGVPYMANESGTKGYILSLGKSLHAEFKVSGIHLTVLVTSPTATPVLGKLGFTRENMPMRPVSVKQCVREALRALSANRLTVIPGRKYRVMNGLMPAGLARKMMGNTIKRINRID